MEKRITIEKDYGEKLNSLAFSSSEAGGISSPKGGSEHFYNSFLCTLKSEADNVNDYVRRLKRFILSSIEKRRE